MKQRCFNPKNPAYHNYGGRGITVCERWRDSFTAFVEDMGPRPVGLTLEREDNDGDYEPSNCSWSTRKQQGANRRGNVVIRWQGRRWLMTHLAEHVGLTAACLSYRIRTGWGVERAVTTPAEERPEFRQLEYEGRMWSQQELADHVGMPRGRLKDRLRLGWDVKKAVETPKMRVIIPATNAA